MRASLTAVLCLSLFGNTAAADGPECAGLFVCSSNTDIPGLFSDPDGFESDGDGWLLGPDLWDILLSADDTGDPGHGGDTSDDGPDDETCDPDEPDASGCPSIPSEDATRSPGQFLRDLFDKILGGGSGGGGGSDDGGDFGGDTGDGSNGGGSDDGGDSGGVDDDGGHGGDTGGGAATGGTAPSDFGGLGPSVSMQSVDVSVEDRAPLSARLKSASPGMRFRANLGDEEHRFRIDQVGTIDIAGHETEQVVFHSLEEFGPVFTLVYDTDRLYLVYYTIPRDELDWNDVMTWWHAQQAE